MLLRHRILSVGPAEGHLFIAGRIVHRGEDVRISYGVKTILHSGNEIGILLGDVVESSIIDTEAGFAILLWNVAAISYCWRGGLIILETLSLSTVCDDAPGKPTRGARLNRF